MQVAIVYGMLCSQYTQWVSSNDAAWMVATIEVGISPLNMVRCTL
jgi:hypothetical protein